MTIDQHKLSLVQNDIALARARINSAVKLMPQVARHNETVTTCVNLGLNIELLLDGLAGELDKLAQDAATQSPTG